MKVPKNLNALIESERDVVEMLARVAALHDEFGMAAEAEADRRSLNAARSRLHGMVIAAAELEMAL